MHLILGGPELLLQPGVVVGDLLVMGLQLVDLAKLRVQSSLGRLSAVLLCQICNPARHGMALISRPRSTEIHSTYPYVDTYTLKELLVAFSQRSRQRQEYVNGMSS